MSEGCLLCGAIEKEVVVYYSDKSIVILRPKAMKGHKFRMMVVTKEHTETVPHWLEDYMVAKLAWLGAGLCNSNKFVIMTPMFGRVTTHAHFVACDLDPKADDFNQVLGTPWVKVVEVRPFRER